MTSTNQHMIRGSIWAVCMRWSIRLVGLISTVILARLLVPEDFGIFAMASLVIAFLDLFTEFGVGMLLIRESNIDDNDCNTAWTFKIIQGVILAALTILVAPYAASYFSEPRLEDILTVLALFPLISGFRNIGMVLVRKELDFAKDFRFEVYLKLAKFFCVIASTLILRNYWGLVFGQILGGIIGVSLSYQMHSYRPRISLSRWRYFTGFSIVLMLANSGKYFNNKIDTIVIGGLFNAATLGLYSVASNLANMATNEVVTPVGRALMPSFSNISSDTQELGKVFLTAFSFIAFLIFPLGIGLASTSDTVVAVLLGDKWDSAAPLLKWLAIYAVSGGLCQLLSGHILITIHREKLVMYMRFARLSILAAVIFYFAPKGDIDKLAEAIMYTGAILVPIYMYVLTRVLPVRMRDLIRSIIRPSLASLLMYAVLTLSPQLSSYVFLELLLKVVFGCLLYFVGIVILWYGSGMPDGPESTLKSKLNELRMAKL